MTWVILILISAVLFASSNIIRKHVLNKEHTLEFLSARGFFTIVLLLCLAPWVDMGIPIRTLGLIFVASLVATIGYYSQTKAQRHTDISYLSPLQNLAPLVLLILAFLFLHESVSVVQLLGVLAIVIGSYVVTVESTKGLFSPIADFKQPFWIHIIISVILLAVAATLDKFMLGVVNPETYLFFGWLFMNLNYIILDWWQYDWQHITVDLEKGWHWLLLCAALSIVSMLIFYHALSFPLVLVSIAFPLRRFSALLETVFGGSLFHERYLIRRIFGCVVMLTGVVLLAAA